MIGDASMVRQYQAEGALPRAGSSWGLVGLLGLTLVAIGRIHEVFPWLASIHIGDLTGGLAVLAFLLAPVPFRDKLPLKIKQVKYVIILFSLGVVTIPISVWPSHSLEFLTGPYFRTVLLFLMVLFWCRSLRDIRRMIWVTCLGVIALVVVGLTTDSIGSSGRLQYGGTYDPNDLAFILAMIIPLMLYLFSTSGNIAKMILLGMAFVSLYAVMLTMSRGGLLSVAIVSVLILAKGAVTKKAKVVLATVLLIVFAGMASSEYWSRIETMWNPQNEYDRTAGGRTTMWKTGLRLLAANPWGVGIGGFVTAEGMSHEGKGKWSAAHNSFLQIGVELGVAGLVVFVLLLGRTMRELRQIQRVHSKPTRQRAGSLRVTSGAQNISQLATALELSLWSFVVGGFFLSHAYTGLLYAVCALSVACVRIAQPVTVYAKESRPPQPPIERKMWELGGRPKELLRETR
jgi:O-antigen ligase